MYTHVTIHIKQTSYKSFLLTFAWPGVIYIYWKGAGDVFMPRVSVFYYSLYFYRMASGGSYELQDSLHCSVCFEPHDSSSHLSKMLSCQHTFCSSCIESLINESKLFGAIVDTFECPVCRSQIRSDEVRTNLAVKDIVEAAVTKEKAKLFCPKHSAKECQIICTDCLQFLCGVCTIKGEHVGHTIDDIDEAKDIMKKRLTTLVETKIANLEKATAAKVEKQKKQLAQQEQDINTIIYMIVEALNEWKKTQLQTAQQAINKELEMSNAQQTSWREKLRVSDFQSLMSACKEAEADGNSDINTNVPLTMVNLVVLQNKLNSLCDSIQALIKDNDVLPSSSPAPTPASPADTAENPISWDFIVHLCSYAVPQNNPCAKRSYIPPCVTRVAKMYNRNRNRQFLHVFHDKRKRHNRLLCRTDDFIYKYDCSDSQRHFIYGVWDSRVSKNIEFLNENKDVLHDQEYAQDIKNAIERWRKITLNNMMNGKPELRWHS